jgi:tetratricopeptide (TPR) repeat protein
VNRAEHRRRLQDVALIVLILAGLASIFGLSRSIDAHRPPPDSALEEEKLYVTGNVARRMSLGFNGLIADWYWMRSLQYVGRKIMTVPQNVPIDNLGALDLKLLAPLLDTATTLDPQFMEAYEYAAVVLPTVNVDEAIRITKKGIAANPGEWRLYHHLGYIYWQRGDFKTAAENYGAGAMLPGAPAWLKAMQARMQAEGGSRGTAREIYTRMYEEAPADSQVKDMARRRLLQLDALDQQDVLRKILGAYKGKTGHCLSAWREVGSLLQTLRFQMNDAGAPLDPAGTPYRLVKDGCDVDLDPKSEVPAR